MVFKNCEYLENDQACLTSSLTLAKVILSENRSVFKKWHTNFHTLYNIGKTMDIYVLLRVDKNSAFIGNDVHKYAFFHISGSFRYVRW